jgi:hypothetical protein
MSKRPERARAGFSGQSMRALLAEHDLRRLDAMGCHESFLQILDPSLCALLIN